MDALCICKNGTHQFAAELLPAGAVSFSLFWIGTPKNKAIVIDVGRSDGSGGTQRWKELRLLVGDEISFVATETNKIDNPIESFTCEDVENLQKSKPKRKPSKKPKAILREIGKLDCEINEQRFSFNLNTDNTLYVAFVWLGDKNGVSRMFMAHPWLPPGKKIPRIRFGDKVIFNWK
jgi:hypothetical protein